MSKRSHFKQSFSKSLVNVREKPPIPMPTKTGVELRCPFCDDHHVLDPSAESPCGTKVEVLAIQEVLSRKLVRKEGLVCVKCHAPGGEMVRYRNSYVHLENCAPETRLLQEIPKFSFLAALVYKIHPRARGLVERVTGRADQVLEIDEFGNKTGKVLGYFFWKGAVNAKRKPITA